MQLNGPFSNSFSDFIAVFPYGHTHTINNDIKYLSTTNLIHLYMEINSSSDYKYLYNLNDLNKFKLNELMNIFNIEIRYRYNMLNQPENKQLSTKADEFIPSSYSRKPPISYRGAILKSRHYN